MEGPGFCPPDRLPLVSVDQANIDHGGSPRDLQVSPFSPVSVDQANIDHGGPGRRSGPTPPTRVRRSGQHRPWRDAWWEKNQSRISCPSIRPTSTMEGGSRRCGDSDVPACPSIRPTSTMEGSRGWTGPSMPSGVRRSGQHRPWRASCAPRLYRSQRVSVDQANIDHGGDQIAAQMAIASAGVRRSGQHRPWRVGWKSPPAFASSCPSIRPTSTMEGGDEGRQRAGEGVSVDQANIDHGGTLRSQTCESSRQCPSIRPTSTMEGNGEPLGGRHGQQCPSIRPTSTMEGDTGGRIKEKRKECPSIRPTSTMEGGGGGSVVRAVLCPSIRPTSTMEGRRGARPRRNVAVSVDQANIDHGGIGTGR